MIIYRQLLNTSLAFFLSAATLGTNAAEKEEPTFDLEKARAAIQQIEPAATPGEPRKMLIYSRANGFRHDSIKYGKEVFPLLGELTGTYTAVVSDESAMFEKDSLEQFDAVMMNNTTRNAFRPHKGKFGRLSREEKEKILEDEKRYLQNLLDYVRGGGGFVGIHAATDTYKDHAGYIDMIGGQFAGHPWHSHMEVVIDVLEPDHPLLQGVFDADEYTLTEEIYAHRDTNEEWIEPGGFRVLLQLNQEKTQRKKNNITFVPISWIKDYGQGRVFYSSLGHNPGPFEKRPTLEAYLRGIQYALGDIPADAAP